MNPMVLHMLLLGSFGKRYTDAVGSLLEHGHHKFQLGDEPCLRLNAGRRLPVAQTESVAAEERPPESIAEPTSPATSSMASVVSASSV